MRALITNDDGIDSEGLKVLENIARLFFSDVYVVAPSHNQSGSAHSFTYKRTFRAHKIDDNHYAIDGTPTDCIIFGIQYLLKDNPPDFVFSGINHGDNSGHAVTYSGTFGAALEAALNNIKSVAFSQTRSPDRTVNFDVCNSVMPKLMSTIIEKVDFSGLVLNINFPACELEQYEGEEVAPYAHKKLISKVVSDDHDRTLFSTICDKAFEEAETNTDMYHLRGNKTTISPISIDWNCSKTLEIFKKYPWST